MISKRSDRGRRLTSLCLFVFFLPGSAATAAIYSRFSYCAPPTPPTCVIVAARKPDTLSACEQEVERYVATVFVYRACLAAETERAVRESNDVIRKMRCARQPAACAATTFGDLN